MAARKFTLFHLSLIQLRQMDIESFEGTREQWIRHSLKESFSFSYRGGVTMHWVKLPDELDDECIYGLLELKRPHERHEPPERGGAEILTEEWQGAYIIIDPTHHNDGQKVAVENDIVGKPGAILGGLIDAINARTDKSYTIEFEPIFDSRSFWRFARDNDHILKSITFDFVVPNMWGAEDGLDKDLKDTGKDTGADRVKVNFSGQQGISTKSDRIKDGVKYAERGAGNVEAKAPDGTPYSSKTKLKTTSVPKVEGDKTTVREYFKSVKGRILGREKASKAKNTDTTGDNTTGD
jgi:hypothetical protein